MDMNRSFSTPTYDSDDIIIARTLKGWINHQELPRWVRSQLLMNALQTSVHSTWALIFRGTLNWVVSSGLGMIALLITDQALVFLPSRDSYCTNPPHLSPCVVHSRVRDTFLLGAGFFGAIA